MTSSLLISGCSTMREEKKENPDENEYDMELISLK